jgi:putative toxin-antitoxin system antitoxin component (TIGR02293 family)
VYLTNQMANRMSATSSAERGARVARARSFGTKAIVHDPRLFWAIKFKRQTASPQTWRRALHVLVDRVMASPGVVLYDAVESGVPTYLVDLIAGATGEAVTRVMDVIGVSPSTYRRKDEADEPLPDAAGHRVMGFLRVMATLRRLLAESGDPEQLAQFDLEAWVARWMREPLPELGDKTPAEMLRNPEGQRAIEQVLERMRGGLPA